MVYYLSGGYEKHITMHTIDNRERKKKKKILLSQLNIHSRKRRSKAHYIMFRGIELWTFV